MQAAQKAALDFMDKARADLSRFKDGKFKEAAFMFIEYIISRSK
jgi:hypothetical protein